MPAFSFDKLVSLLQVLAPIFEKLLPLLVPDRPVAPPPLGPPPPDHQIQLPVPVPVITPVLSDPKAFEGLQLFVAEIYHDWFKDEIQPGVFSNDIKATPEEIQRIMTGRQPLPPGAKVHFNVEPFPSGLSLEDIPMPISMVYSIKGPELNGTETFTPEPGHRGHYEGLVANIQGQDRPGGGLFDRSNGYSGILSTKAAKDGPHEAWMTAIGGGKNSNTIHFPWVAKES